MATHIMDSFRDIFIGIGYGWEIPYSGLLCLYMNQILCTSVENKHMFHFSPKFCTTHLFNCQDILFCWIP